MDVETFRAALTREAPPTEWSAALRALWHDARGDWDRAHEIAQEDESADGSWVHAYLHRREGDHSNARYWYNRARRPVSAQSLDEERESIAADLLARTHRGR